jgi:hypothetical protein
MRKAGTSPKGIARALGVRPAVVAPLVRRLAAEAPELPPEQGEVVGCWVSPGWSRELLVERGDGWDDVDVSPDGPAGIAQVLLARADRRDQMIMCGYLVDTFCLGVKDAYGPERMRARDVPGFVRTYFRVFPDTAVPAPLDLAQQLVHGAVAFAARLGFDPHPDFAGVREYLGEIREPCAITFGRRGRPFYVAGPHDDPIAVVSKLQTTVGSDAFTVAA